MFCDLHGYLSIPRSQIPEFMLLFSTHCKAYVVWYLRDILPLPVILWQFISKLGENCWQDKDVSCLLRLALALMGGVD